MAVVIAPHLVLRHFRGVRASRHREEIDVWEALYRLYVALFIVAGTLVAVVLLIGDRPIAASRIRGQAPAMVGLVPAAAVAAGLRSGSRGGPLALEAPDIAHVLLGPIDRRRALARPIWQQARSVGAAAAGVGAASGFTVARPLPGSLPEWIMYGATFAVCCALSGLGSAMIVSGRHAPKRVVSAATAGILGTSILDVAFHTSWSPGTAVAQIGLAAWLGAPSFAGWLALIGSVVVWVVGATLAAGVSVEALARRSNLVSVLRFSLGLNDLRAVVTLRRTLANETTRQQPWLELPAVGSATTRRVTHGLLRWPLRRIVRLVALGVIAGLATRVAVGGGPTALLAVGGVAMLACGLEATDGLGQTHDLPHLRDLLPVERGRLEFALTLPGCIVCLIPATAGAVAGWALHPSRMAAAVAALTLVPAALLAGGSAAFALRDQATIVNFDWSVPAEMAGPALVFKFLAAPTLATVGLLPAFVAGRATRAAVPPIGQAVVATALSLLAAVTLLAWVRGHHRLQARRTTSQQIT